MCPFGSKCIALLGMLSMVAVGRIDASPAGHAPEDLLAQGQELIENNCGDCHGATAEGVRDGIEKVEAALANGVRQRADACRELAHGYSTLAIVFAPPDSADQKALGKRQAEALACAAEAAPDDPDTLYEYSTVQDQESAIRTLKRVLELDPHHRDALFSLGIYETEAGNRAGLAKMKEAFELAEASDDAYAIHIGDRLLEQLAKFPHEEKEAREITARMSALDSHCKE